MRSASRILLAGIVLCLLVPAHALAQYPFGKNKINYEKKDWKVLETENVDIYYYPSEQNLVAFMTPIVEETYDEFSKLFRIDFRGRVPLVFYSSHYDFQQTNIIPSLISEHTGGFTDLMKGRIAIPYTGSLWDLRHVVRHEMVHAFMLEKIAQVMSSQGRFSQHHPPLWFIEGMAEYFASPSANTRSHMFVRDALIHDRLPDLMNIWRIQGSFMMYKEGEAAIRYIVANYGEDAIIRILENWWTSDKFTLILQRTIGVDLPQLSDGFMRALKRKYYPEILHRTFAPDIGTQLTTPGTFHSRPAVAKGSDFRLYVYTMFAEDGVVNIGRIYQNDKGRLVREKLIEGSRSTDFESIPVFRSKLEARGDTLLFVAKRGERDAIYIWNARENKKIAALQFAGLSVLSSPTFSPRKDKIAFSAIDWSGTMDLYTFDLYSGHLDRLTFDPYSEENADYHPHKDVILFSSDRCETGKEERKGIYVIDTESKHITALTCGRAVDNYPDWSPDGESFLFTSDRDGVFNVYQYHYNQRTVSQQTNVIGGITTPAFMPDGRSFLANGYYKSEYHLFKFPIKGGSAGEVVAVAFVDSASATWMQKEPLEFDYKTQDYKQKLGLDFAGAGIAIDPDFGSLGNGGQVVLSDILGNHKYYFFFGNSSERVDNFFKQLNVGANYVNLSNRLNYSLGVFHLTQNIGDFFSILRSERRYGVSAGLSYPFNKFTRLDGSVVVRFVERDLDFEGLHTTKTLLGSTFLTYVVDNTIWTIGGPLKGWRWYTTVGQTVDFRDRGFDYTTVQFDLRQYFKITNRIVLAERFQTRHAWGNDFQLFYLGGPWDLRGYKFREFYGRSTYLLNNELRFPLIDRFALTLPFGTLETPMMRGSLFLDVARVNRYIFDSEYLGSMGAGVEFNLGYAPVIRVNFTRQTDFDTISSKTEFELFIGYNY